MTADYGCGAITILLCLVHKWHWTSQKVILNIQVSSNWSTKSTVTLCTEETLEFIIHAGCFCSKSERLFIKAWPEGRRICWWHCCLCLPKCLFSSSLSLEHTDIPCGMVIQVCRIFCLCGRQNYHLMVSHGFIQAAHFQSVSIIADAVQTYLQHILKTVAAKICRRFWNSQ